MVKIHGLFLRAAMSLALLLALPAFARDYPPVREGEWIARDFLFHSGEVIPKLRLHYTTVGTASGQPVLILHGTSGSGASLLTADFAGELFGEGQPLDVRKYFIILPDAIGHGKSSKPSDGLHAKFPAYNYDDMVEAQYRLVTEGLGMHHLRLVLGFSMGGMHSWIWAESYPSFMDAVVPMASQPVAMSSRNWMMRRLVIDSIRNDPEWKNGEYAQQPRSAQFATVFYLIATNGGTLKFQKLAPTRAAADKLLDGRLHQPLATDANDLLYQYEASRDYDPSPRFGNIAAQVLAINSADDERNPPETGVTENALKRVKNASLYLIPASEETSGHVTVLTARLWVMKLRELLDRVPVASLR